MREKRKLRIQKRKQEIHENLREIYREAEDIIESEHAKCRRNHIQHGTTSVHRHCVDVAVRSIYLNRKLKLNASERELIRGALLHDYFLYDWHDRKIRLKLHGFRHPKRALQNAIKEYELTDKEQDIIVKHMWPLTIITPKYRESWIVTAVDKYSALAEMYYRMRRKG